MIQIKNLTKFFGQKTLFSDVDFSISDGEKLGLIGRNGSGKSTFLRLLLEQEIPDDGTIEIPEFWKISSLEQHLSFEKKTLLEQVCRHFSETEKDERWKAKSVLLGLGFLESDFEKNPKVFSSGFQIRIRLAETLVQESDLLVLDEPTNYLDIVSLRWLEKFLQNWKNSFILVTHDHHFMEKVVSHSVVIHRGKMRKMKGGPKKLLEHIAKDEEIYEKTRQNREKKDKKTEEFIRNFRAGARSAGLVQSRIKALEKQDILEELEKLPEIFFRFKTEPFRGNMLLEARNLTFSYKESISPEKNLIEKFSLEILPTQRIAIVGPNGKGKSTLLNLLSEKIAPLSGHVAKGSAVKLGYFGSESKKDLHPERTILEEIYSVGGVSEQEVRNVCGSLLFSGEDVKKQIKNLSGGEKSRVCLAKTLLFPCHVLFLDEPTNHLDMESCFALLDGLKKFEGTVVFVSHDEDFLSELSTRLVVFDGGKITVKEKTYLQFLEEEGWETEEKNEKKEEKISDQKKQYEEKKEREKRILKLQTEQKKWEQEITACEKKQEENNVLFLLACEKKDQASIRTLGENAKKLTETLENCWQCLEKALEEEENLRQ